MAKKHCVECSGEFDGQTAQKFCSPQCRLRFFSQDHGACRVWCGPKFRDGYGKTSVGTDTAVRAHRLSYEAHVGAIPEGALVLHRCDTPLCIAPDHLFLGSPADNSKDMVSKRRQVAGARHHKAKLTEEDVVAIRSDPRPHGQIAKDYGVVAQSIQMIKARKTWSHI